MKVNLKIYHQNKIYIPLILSGVKLTQERQGSPSKLEFDVYKDKEKFEYEEGDMVTFQVDNKKMFKGYIFKIKFSQDNILKITAYDQLRYLKNKDTMMYQNLTVAGVIRQIAANFNLTLGDIEDPGYCIPKRLEKNQTLFDMIQSAQDETLTKTGILTVLYDDYGSISLKNIENMKTNVMVDISQAEGFDYETSIDSDTYNKIKLTYDNKETGVREIFIAQDHSTFGQWGILQYLSDENNQEGCAEKANQLLKYYNKKKKSLNLKNVKGSSKVRAGSSVFIKLNLGDMILKNYMMCEKVTHNFTENYHSMDLDLRGNIYFY